MALVVVAKQYQEYVDEDDPPFDTVKMFVSGLAFDQLYHHVEDLVKRWQLMIVYMKHAMPRAGTAKAAGWIARESAQRLTAKLEIPSVSWSSDGDLWPQRGTDLYLSLSHSAASLDISSWLLEWREEVLPFTQWYATHANYALLNGLYRPEQRAAKRQTNRILNVLQQELASLTRAIKVDQSKPRSDEAIRRSKQAEADAD